LRMRTILWDLDGTIADTEALHFHAWQAALHVDSIEYEHATFLADFGRNNREILTDLLGDAATPALIQEISRRKERLFRNALPTFTVPPLPGVIHWLAHRAQWPTSRRPLPSWMWAITSWRSCRGTSCRGASLILRSS